MRRLVCLMLALMLTLCLCACGEKTEAGKKYEDIPGLEDGILTVGMECAYAPYNWMQMDDSNGAVPIANNAGAYANGYDVMIAKKIADYYDVALEVMAVGWDGLNPALAEGSLDAVIAGQSMTEERMEEVTMAGPYFYANIVCLARKDTVQASATGISQMTGNGTAQDGTVWYNTFLDQMPGITKTSAAETATAMGACAIYDNLVILDFNETADNFTASAGDINIGVSVKKGNNGLADMMDAVLKDMTADDFNNLMNQAIDIQPEI